jgi:hypothetical protein
MRGACLDLVGELSERGGYDVPGRPLSDPGRVVVISFGSAIAVMLRASFGFTRIGFRALLGSFLLCCEMVFVDVILQKSDSQDQDRAVITARII